MIHACKRCIAIMIGKIHKVVMQSSRMCAQTLKTVSSAVLDRYRYSRLNRYFIAVKRSPKAACLTALIGLLSLFFVLLYIVWPNNEVVLPFGVDPNRIPPFEPAVISDFPEGDPLKPKIPKIIHWTFKDTSIPPSFHSNIKSFVDNNPDWTFYMWTDESSRKYIVDTHPELLSTYDSYKEPIRRADFIRYVVLYEIGGVYADLDVIDYRPLDRLVSKYTCIFPTEPFEHAVLRAFVPYLINNAIMLCKPKHPFMKQILENLPRFEHMFKVLDATGPAFITTQFMIYNKLGRDDGVYNSEGRSSNSPYFYKGKLPEDHEDAVYIPNSQYFCNNIDPTANFFFYRACKDFLSLNDLEKRACGNLAAKGMFREKNKYAFLEHQFYRTYAFWHFYNYLDIYLHMFSKDIRELVPNVKIYEGKKIGN